MGPILINASCPVPADEGFSNASPSSSAEVIETGEVSPNVASERGVPPELSDDTAEKRNEAKKIVNPEQKSVAPKVGSCLLVQKILEFPFWETTFSDGRPDFRAGQQPDMVMRDIGQRVPVDSLQILEFIENHCHVFERVFVLFDITLESIQASPVELDKAPASYPLNDKSEIRRAHWKKGNEGQPSPKVHSHMPFGGGRITLQALERIRLALACAPFVLPGQLVGSHGVHEAD
jgi:hypothetical protein